MDDVIAEFQVLTRNLSGEAKENYDNFQESRYIV